MRRVAKSWTMLNPEYEYGLFDDDDLAEFVRSEFPDFLPGWQKLKHGAAKADLWRYLVMFRYGGVYADLDCFCRAPMREWISPEAAYVTQLGVNHDLCQWLLISVPGNPIFLKAAERALDNILCDRCSVEYDGFQLVAGELTLRQGHPRINIHHSVLAVTGPPVLQEAAEECFKHSSCPAIFQHTQVVCISESSSCNMAGNVKHDHGNQDYLEELRQLRTPHYLQS
jgi:mannosyltransferase OCH1-like enzyme